MKRVAQILSLAALLVTTIPARAVRPGDLAPNFALNDLNGTRVELETLTREGPALLDFGSVFCTACQETLRWLEGARRTFGPRGLTVVAVNVDGAKASHAVAAVTRNLGVGYPVLLDGDGTVAEAYDVQAIPYLVLVTPGGKVQTVHRGFDPNLAQKLKLENTLREQEQ